MRAPPEISTASEYETGVSECFRHPSKNVVISWRHLPTPPIFASWLAGKRLIPNIARTAGQSNYYINIRTQTSIAHFHIAANGGDVRNDRTSDTFNQYIAGQGRALPGRFDSSLPGEWNGRASSVWQTKFDPIYFCQDIILGGMVRAEARRQQRITDCVSHSVRLRQGSPLADSQRRVVSRLKYNFVLRLGFSQAKICLVHDQKWTHVTRDMW
jgi:hypothetical protein